METLRLKPARAGYLDRTLRMFSGLVSDAMLREQSAERSWVGRHFDARAVVLSAVVLVVSVSFARTLSSLLLHFVLVLGLLLVSRVRLGDFLRSGFAVAGGLAIVLAIPATMNVFRDGTLVFPLFEVPSVRDEAYIVGLTREGLWSGVFFVLRVTTSVAAVVWMTLTVRWSSLLQALRSFGLSAVIVQTIAMTVVYIHVLLRQSEESYLARQSRSICRVPLSAEHAWLGSRITAGWESNLQLMDDVHQSMMARGFDGERPSAAGGWSSLRLLDVFAVLATLLVSVGVHFV